MGLYSVPQTFSEELEKEFGDRIRVRWSDQWNEWHVEQKVRRGLAASPSKFDPYDDTLIRHKDGYVWIMSVKQGTRFDCPKCGLTLKAPTRETKQVSCDHCRMKGYNHQWIASHWPLDHTLIEHLKMLERQIDTKSDMLHKSDMALRKIQERAVLDPTLAAFEDRHSKLAGILSVGYTGKEKMWQRDAKD